MGNCLSSDPAADSAVDDSWLAIKQGGDAGGGRPRPKPIPTTSSEVVVAPTSVLAKQYFLLSRLPDPQGVAVRAGATWCAREKSSSKLAVLRVLQLPLESGLVPLVCREVLALAPALLNSHPNVMPAKSVVLTAEHLTLVMAAPFADGKLVTLDAHAGVSKKVPNRPGLNMPEPLALYFFLQMLAAMEYFHGKKLAHLNFDLATMVLDTSAKPPTLQLMDSGFAKSWRVASDLTYSRQQWSTGAKHYLRLTDSITDMNRSVKGRRSAGDSARGGRAFVDLNSGANLDSSARSGVGVCGLNSSGRGCSAVHDLNSSIRGSVDLGLAFGSGHQHPPCHSARGKLGGASRESSGSDQDSNAPCGGSGEWDFDTVLGCSFESGQAVDVFSCGCSLFALLMGAYPQSLLQREIEADPTSAAAAIHLQMVLGWQDHPAARRRYQALSADCQELLLRMLASDEAERITLPEIKAHPWVARGPGPEFEPPLAALQRRNSIGGSSNTAKALGLSKESANIMNDLKKKLCETVWHAANMDSGLSPTEVRSLSVGQPYGAALQEATVNCLSLIPEAASFSAQGGTAGDAAQLKKLLTHTGPDDPPPPAEAAARVVRAPVT